MINSLMALLVELELLTKEEGESMAQKLRTATLPSEFNSAHKQIKEFLKDAKAGN